MYIVMGVKTYATVMLLDMKVMKLPISDMAEGCIGCMLVFDSKEAAEKWAAGKFKIMEIDEAEND